MVHHYPAFIVLQASFSRIFYRKTGFKYAFTLLFLLLLSPGLVLAQITFRNFEEARLVVGQTSFTTRHRPWCRAHAGGYCRSPE
jgi:hypothetical protein